jgi:uncharacterized protein
MARPTNDFDLFQAVIFISGRRKKHVFTPNNSFTTSLPLPSPAGISRSRETKHAPQAAVFALIGYNALIPTVRNPFMRPSVALQTHRDAIREIALRHRVKNVRVFGSVLHGDDTEDSDLDLLVDPTPETTLMDIAKIQVEVARLLDITVDVLTPRALPDKFRDQVIKEAQPV